MEITPAEGAKRITFLLGRLTVMRSLLAVPPVSMLCELCDAIVAQDATLAVYKYHQATGALLEQSTRRVTGDIWKDFLFSELLETPNRFSVLAAEGKMDPPVQLAMKNDLRLIQELFALSSQTILGWIEGIGPDKRRQHAIKPPEPDYISRMATSAWSGGSSYIRDRRKLNHKAPIEVPSVPQQLDVHEWATWDYDEPGEPVEYVADDGLAIIYRQFLADDDWANLVEPLLDFHTQYGCGEFLHYRIFIASDDGLHGVDDYDIPEWDSLIDFSSHKEKLYANTLRFLHTGKAEDALLYGADGMGKTSIVLSLLRELPDLRMIFMTQRDLESTLETMRTLQRQPFRFIAFMDDLALSELQFHRLKASLIARKNSNALVYATAIEPTFDQSVFGLSLCFEMLDEEKFLETVHSLVKRSRINVSPYTVDEAIAKWNAESDDLSVRAAQRIAQQIIRARQA